jgi:hypothetical protein
MFVGEELPEHRISGRWPLLALYKSSGRARRPATCPAALIII